MSTRDNQKQRLYNAERAANLDPSEIGRRLLVDTERIASTGSVTIEACQQYVDHLTQSAWFQRRWGRRQYKVRHKVYGRATWSTGNIISAPPWARDEWVLLHEVAHGLADAPHHADHGPEFAGVLLTLVEHRMGKDAAARLRAAYKGHRVRYTKAAVPAPTRAVREPLRPVRVPSRAVAAARAAERAEREERESKVAAREQSKVTPGIVFAAVDDDAWTHWSRNWECLSRRLAEQAAGRLADGLRPLTEHGLVTTSRGATHCVRWTAEQREDGMWVVLLFDRLTGKERERAGVMLG